MYADSHSSIRQRSRKTVFTGSRGIDKNSAAIVAEGRIMVIERRVMTDLSRPVRNH